MKQFFSPLVVTISVDNEFCGSYPNECEAFSSSGDFETGPRAWCRKFTTYLELYAVPAPGSSEIGCHREVKWKRCNRCLEVFREKD